MDLVFIIVVFFAPVLSKIFILFYKTFFFKSSVNGGGVKLNASTNDMFWERSRGYFYQSSLGNGVSYSVG